MSHIDIYTKDHCPYCRRARALLDGKGVAYHDIEVSTSQALQQQMRERSGRRTVPQIFIGDYHIGGSDELLEAERNGLLDKLLDRYRIAAA